MKMARPRGMYGNGSRYAGVEAPAVFVASDGMFLPSVSFCINNSRASSLSGNLCRTFEFSVADKGTTRNLVLK